MEFNRKAQGSGITWFVVIIALFLILGIYLLSIVIITKGINPDASVKVSVEYSENKSDFVPNVLLVSFLTTEINFNSAKIKIKDLIAEQELNDGTKSRFTKFQEEATKFMDTNFPLKDTQTIEKTFSDSSGYRTFWLRIYDTQEGIYSYPDKSPFPMIANPLKYNQFIVNKYISTPLGSNHYCDPLSEKTLFTYIFISPDKKIALCAEPYST